MEKCSCGKSGSYAIRGLPLCAEHYIEALEHSAHIVVMVWPVDDGPRMTVDDLVQLWQERKANEKLESLDPRLASRGS
jgi:hypothetical protein